MEEDLRAVVEMDSAKLDSKDMEILKFTRKVLLEPQTLTREDFDILRKEGLTDGEIVRLIAIIAFSVGEVIVRKAIGPEINS